MYNAKKRCPTGISVGQFCFMLKLLLIALSAYRIAEMLGPDGGYGPFNLLEKMRAFVGVDRDKFGTAYGTNVVGEIFSCRKCLTFWVSVVIGLFSIAVGDYSEIILLPFAAAGAAEFLRAKDG